MNYSSRNNFRNSVLKYDGVRVRKLANGKLIPAFDFRWESRAIVFQDEDVYEADGLRVVHVRCNKRTADAVLRTYAARNRAVRQMLDEGYFLEQHGCDCTHCQMDWDCCGTRFVQYTTIERARRGLRFIQHTAINV